MIDFLLSYAQCMKFACQVKILPAPLLQRPARALQVIVLAIRGYTRPICDQIGSNPVMTGIAARVSQAFNRVIHKHCG
jgi:hypothetical protein